MAISYADSNTSNASTVSANSAFNLGDLIFVVGITLNSGATFADNVNTGTYTALGTQQQQPGGGDFVNYAYKIVNVTSVTVPTITTTSGSTVWHSGFSRYTGFVLGAHIILADNSAATGTSASANSGTVVASKNNEIFWGTVHPDGQTITVTDAFFALKQSGDASQLDTSGIGLISAATSVAQTSTLGSSDPWVSFIQGFNDAASVSGGGSSILLLGV